MDPVIISIPLGLLTAAFVIIAEFPDYQADKETGKNNLTVRLGIKNARFLYAAVCAAAYLSIPAGILTGIMPVKGLLAGFAALISLAACIELWKKYETPSKLGLACGLTLAAHLICGILLTASYF
jgi:1,4-dihydroxy-2-naphthoate polyprenyltransferase